MTDPVSPAPERAARTVHEQDEGWTTNPLPAVAGSTARTEAPRDATEREPGWLARYCAACRAFATLPHGWDSYDAPPPSFTATERGVDALVRAVQLGYLPASVSPAVDGGVLITFPRASLSVCDPNADDDDFVAVWRDGSGTWEVRGFREEDGDALDAALHFACAPRAPEAAAGSVVLAVDPASGTRADSRSTPDKATP